MVGSLANLYQSIENLHDSYIQPNQTKHTLLKPVSSVSGSVPLLAINDAPATERKYYRCTCNHFGIYVSDDNNTNCPNCKNKMTINMYYVAPPAVQQGSNEGGIVKGVVTYMVMDDLVVTPLSTISTITLLKKFHFKDVNALEERVVNFGMDESLKFNSRMKSTNLQTYSSMANSSISLKLLIDTQAKRVLFAEAGKEFVDFLFHILSLPVAKIITLLGKQEMVGSLGNLYQSIGKLNESYIQPNQTKKTLLKPDSGSSIPLLAIKNARTANKFYTCRGCINLYNVSNYVSDDSRAACPDCGLFMNEKLQYVDPPQVQVCSTSEGGFMKGVVTYMVMDDLAAVKLLKASLETKNVLTHVFLNVIARDSSGNLRKCMGRGLARPAVGWPRLNPRPKRASPFRPAS
ncbi:hypothetical protein DH2020_021146 [Rehmannia glutinosa]|uniref:DUF674 domain-containing protein n=1 Tax=Rehmannia glutinosa TaxID=99300 RepID=A0ABR0WC33_REHGL